MPCGYWCGRCGGWHGYYPMPMYLEEPERPRFRRRRYQVDIEDLEEEREMLERRLRRLEREIERVREGRVERSVEDGEG